MLAADQRAATVDIVVQAEHPEPISFDLFGIFVEDLITPLMVAYMLS
jgi:hypothetical protein